MAQIVPTEGLDYLLGLITGDTTQPTTLYLGLLSGGDGTTVPAASATLAAMGGSFAEANYTGYGRVAVAAADWGAIGADTIGTLTARATTAAQKSFAAATAADADANLTGFFLCTVTSGTAGVALLYSNFDGGAADVIASLALGDIVRVTPTFGLGDIAGVA